MEQSVTEQTITSTIGANDTDPLPDEIRPVLPERTCRSYILRGADGTVEITYEVEVYPHFTNIVEKDIAFADDQDELQLSGVNKEVRWRSIHHHVVEDPFSDLDGTDLGYIVREWWSADPNVDRSNLWDLPTRRGRRDDADDEVGTPIRRRVVSRWTTADLARLYIRHNLERVKDCNGEDAQIVLPPEDSTNGDGQDAQLMLPVDA